MIQPDAWESRPSGQELGLKQSSAATRREEGASGARLPPLRTRRVQQQLPSRAYHLLCLPKQPTTGQESEDSEQILIKIQDFSFYCIRCLTTIILIGKKFIYTNKLTSNHKALLFVFKL